MQRVDGYYLYSVGSRIHPLSEFRSPQEHDKGTSLLEAYLPLLIAEGALDTLLYQSVFRLVTLQQAGGLLLAAVRDAKKEYEEATDKTIPLHVMTVYRITTALRDFEAVLAAEFGVSDLYVVTKRGYETSALIWGGQIFFPAELSVKVPASIPDIQQATRCIAFELPTAAGFHLHRANEAVLHAYWDAVTKGAPRPGNRNMGDYITSLKRRRIKDAKTLAALRDLKDLHRNPLIHPDHSLESVDEAIALMNGVHSVVVRMLQRIPVPAPLDFSSQAVAV